MIKVIQIFVFKETERRREQVRLKSRLNLLTHKFMDNTTLLLALLPIAVISLALEIFTLVDLIRRDKRQVQGGNKWIWAIIILLVNPIGSIVYLVAGRTEGGQD